MLRRDKNCFKIKSIWWIFVQTIITIRIVIFLPPPLLFRQNGMNHRQVHIRIGGRQIMVCLKAGLTGNHHAEQAE